MQLIYNSFIIQTDIIQSVENDNGKYIYCNALASIGKPLPPSQIRS